VTGSPDRNFLEGAAADLDTALGDVDRPVFVLRRDLQSGAWGKRRVDVQRVSEKRTSGERAPQKAPAMTRTRLPSPSSSGRASSG